MTLLEALAGLVLQGSRRSAAAPNYADKRTKEGAVLRAEVDDLLATADRARADGDLWNAAQSTELASQKLDAAGVIRRAIELRRDAAATYTKFAESASPHADVVAGYTRAARAFLAAGDIDAAKDFSDRARGSDPAPR